eukprot:scaffold12962_cov135-Isochrysis_galbana.AAC.1
MVKRLKAPHVGSLERPLSKQLITNTKKGGGPRSQPSLRPPSQCSARGIGAGHTQHINLKAHPPAEKAANFSSCASPFGGMEGQWLG